MPANERESQLDPLAELAELASKATPGEWILHRNCYGDILDVAVFNQERYERLNGGGCGPSTWHDKIVSGWLAKEADLKFIAAAHNLLTPATLAAIREREGEELSEGHGQPCYYCGKPCNNLTGRCGQWAVGLCHEDEPGVVKWHHDQCVSERLAALTAAQQEAATAKARIERLEAALRNVVEGYDGWVAFCDDPEDGCAEVWQKYIDEARAALAERGPGKESEGANG